MKARLIFGVAGGALLAISLSVLAVEGGGIPSTMFNTRIIFTNNNGNAAVGSAYNPSNTSSVNVNNTAMGQFSLNSGSTATNMTDNTVVGGNAFKVRTTNGCCETAIGKWALENDLNGKFNTSVGSDTMRYFTGGGGTATGNPALGHGALGGDDTTPANNTASGNTAIGARSQHEIPTRLANSRVGDTARPEFTT